MEQQTLEAPAEPGALQRIDVTRVKPITPGVPWHDWPEQSSARIRLDGLRVTVVEDKLAVATLDGEELGEASVGFLREVSTRAGFPTDFVTDLPLDLQARVVESRLQRVDKPFTLTSETRKVLTTEGLVLDPAGRKVVTNACPGWRGIVSQTDVCQTVYDLLSSVFGDTVQVRHAVRGDGEVRLRIMTGFGEEVTRTDRKVGDFMGLGVDVHHRPGFRLAVTMFVEVLRCENGMKSAEECFSWKSQEVGRPEDQLAWLTVGVANVVSAFDGFVAKSRLMLDTEVGGDPTAALLERAKAMRIPSRFHDRLRASFDTFPGATEWHMLNAITHLATHGGLPPQQSEALQVAGGRWTEGFDMVNARLPRPIAVAAGATIVEDGE